MEIFFHISWRRDSGAGGSCDTNTIQSGQLIGFSNYLTCQSGCSGNIGTLLYKCTDYSMTENWSFGENKLFYTFSNLEKITIGYSSCCWISGVGGNWNISTSFSMIPRNDTGVINSTPRATTSPVIRLLSGCNHTIQIPVTDPDQNDIVKCRWAVGSECSDVCNGIPGAVLDSDTCTITYEANKGTGYKAVALTMEDFTTDDLIVPLSKVGLQFLVYVFSSSDQSCSTSPKFRSPTLMQGVCIAFASNDTFTTQILADSHTSDTSISEIVTVSPSGTIKGDLNQITDSNLYYVNISWTPSIAQQGQTHVLCYIAINSDGLSSEQICIKLSVGILPPEPNATSLSPASNSLVDATANATWSIQFNKDIQRPSVSSFIKFHNATNDEVVHKIDTSSSSEVNFESDELIISPNFALPEKQFFYITFEGGVVNSLEGCEPGNNPITEKTFWEFETPETVSTTIAVYPAAVSKFILGSKVTATCYVTGKPIPTVQWYKDGMLLSKANNGITIVQTTNPSNITSVLTISSLIISHEGNYTCNGTNTFPNGTNTFPNGTSNYSADGASFKIIIDES